MRVGGVLHITTTVGVLRYPIVFAQFELQFLSLYEAFLGGKSYAVRYQRACNYLQLQILSLKFD